MNNPQYMATIIRDGMVEALYSSAYEHMAQFWDACQWYAMQPKTVVQVSLLVVPA